MEKLIILLKMPPSGTKLGTLVSLDLKGANFMPINVGIVKYLNNYFYSRWFFSPYAPIHCYDHNSVLLLSMWMDFNFMERFLWNHIDIFMSMDLFYLTHRTFVEYCSTHQIICVLNQVKCLKIWCGTSQIRNPWCSRGPGFKPRDDPTWSYKARASTLLVSNVQIPPKKTLYYSRNPRLHLYGTANS